MKENRNYKEIVEAFSKTLEINPNDYYANFRIGLLAASEGKIKQRGSYFNKILMNVGSDNLYFQNTNYNSWLTFSELIERFQADIMISKIAINSNREYTARGNINQALRTAELFEEIPLMKRIADSDEMAYRDFALYHKYSAPVYILYSYLEPWGNVITSDYNLKETLQKRLSKYK